MPRMLSRNVHRQIGASSVIPVEIFRVSTSAPFDRWDYRFTSNNRQTEFAGHVYAPIGLERDDAQTDANYSIDRIGMRFDNTNRFWSRLVGLSVLTGVRVQVLKVFLNVTESEDDGIVIFDGFIGSPSFDSQSFSFEIRSVLAYYRTELPTRTYQPNCNYHLFSDSCGADITLAVNTRTITAGQGSSRWRIIDPIALGDLPPHHWDGGYVVTLTGQHRGMIRPIETSGVNGLVSLLVPYDFDTSEIQFLIRRGCSKTKDVCDGRHGRLSSYGGFAEVPQEPASVGHVIQS